MSRAYRLATLIVPSAIAAMIILTAKHHHEPVTRSTAPYLAVLWGLMLGVLAVRAIEAKRHGASAWKQLDVLTGAGRATMWTGAAMIAVAALSGWASMSVLGVLGLGSVYLAATWTTLVAGGVRPWRSATVTRTIQPDVATEGDLLREELHLDGVKIPAGMRMFATGRASRFGVVSRYVVGSEGSGADVRLEASLGAVPRGDHEAPPLAMWLGDVFGLTRSPIVFRGELAKFTVMPKPAAVDGVKELLGLGGDASTSRPTDKMPTEGIFRIREYVPGDDMRRIHWVRSLQANELVVRLPDEIPPADPNVRLVLDNALWGAGFLSCHAPDQLLDATVRVWLGIAKALADNGTRVTLVSSADLGNGQAVVERAMHPRAMREAQRFGARIEWQCSMSLEAMLKRRTDVKQVVVTCRPRALADAPEVLWVAVPEAAWTTPEPWPLSQRIVRLPYPNGSADNRLGRRMREQRRIELMWKDRSLFSQIMCWRVPSGAYLAHPSSTSDGKVALQVIP